MIEYVVVAAAGGHNLIMIGAPGCGNSMIAKRIPTILPSMTDEESLEVTKIYSVAGILREKKGLISERPFRAPHHNASTNSLIGDGAVVSGYPPGIKARSEYFPERNSLISSWSKKILVVEAGERSGALITADFAMELGREVLVPPHEIYNVTGKGTNRLIAEGSALYMQPYQLLFEKNNFN